MFKLICMIHEILKQNVTVSQLPGLLWIIMKDPSFNRPNVDFGISVQNGHYVTLSLTLTLRVCPSSPRVTCSRAHVCDIKFNINVDGASFDSSCHML